MTAWRMGHDARTTERFMNTAFEFDIKPHEQGAGVAVKVVPGSSRTRLAGRLDRALKVNIAAAPEKGKANKDLCQFLAGLLGVAKGDVEVIAGHTRPHKEVLVRHMSVEQLRTAINELLSTK